MWGKRAIMRKGAKRVHAKNIPARHTDYPTPMTDEQRSELKRAFSMFEKAGNKGRLAVRDLVSLLRCLGWNPSEKDLEEARQEMDLATKGFISFSDVEAYIAKRGGIYHGASAEKDILVAFQVLDTRGTGRITVSDFRHFLMTMGERMSAEEAEELISCSRQHGKDYIEYKGPRAYLRFQFNIQIVNQKKLAYVQYGGPSAADWPM